LRFLQKKVKLGVVNLSVNAFKMLVPDQKENADLRRQVTGLVVLKKQNNRSTSANVFVILVFSAKINNF